MKMSLYKAPNELNSASLTLVNNEQNSRNLQDWIVNNKSKVGRSYEETVRI